MDPPAIMSTESIILLFCSGTMAPDWTITCRLPESVETYVKLTFSIHRLPENHVELMSD